MAGAKFRSMRETRWTLAPSFFAACFGLALLGPGCDDKSDNKHEESEASDPDTSQPGNLDKLPGGPGGARGPNGAGLPGRSPGSPAPGGAPASSGFFDAGDLVTSIRPAARADLAAAAGVTTLDTLPLYDLDITLDDALTSFQLKEEIYWTNTSKTDQDEVVLRVYANSSEGGTARSLVTFQKGECSGMACAVKEEAPSTISVKLDKPIAPGEHLRIKLDFSGKLEEIDASRTTLFAQSLEGLSMLGGGEMGSFGLLAKGDDISSLANFYAVVARQRDGKWERDDKSTMGDLGSDDMAHVRARVDVPERATVATTGVTSAQEVKGGRRVQTVQAGMVRDFAIVASPSFETATRNVGDVVIRSYFLSKERKAGEKVLDVAAAALETYEKRFGQYPYADLDVVEAALIGGAGGVEFAGLVTVASMFYRPAMPSDGFLGALFGMLGGMGGGASGNPMDEMTDKMLEFVTAHEVAHQYWHGLVGNDSRNHPYVDESMAQFSAIQYLHERYGKERAKQDGDLNVAMNYKTMRMLGRPDAPADRGVADFGDMLTYAGIVYGKAPYLWVTLRDELGDDAFFRGVQKYVSDNRLKLAKPGALVDALAAADPAKSARVRELAKRWLEELHGDEDIGKGNLLDMLGPSLGMDMSTMDPAMRAMMEQMMEMLMGAASGGGLGGPSGGPLGSPGGPGVMDDEMKKLFEMLMGADDP